MMKSKLEFNGLHPANNKLIEFLMGSVLGLSIFLRTIFSGVFILTQEGILTMSKKGFSEAAYSLRFVQLSVSRFVY